MSNLLTVKKFTSKAAERGKVPLMIEDVPVDPLCAPYLVTSSTGVMWVEKAHPGDVVRIAVREVTPGAIFTELFEAIVTRSIKDKWGSVLPHTEKGLLAAINYLAYFGLDEVEILIPPTPKTEWSSWILHKNLGLHVRPSSWIPDGYMVVIPHDRDYVGMIGHLDGKRIAALVHNASRGIAVLQKPKSQRKPKVKQKPLSKRAQKALDEGLADAQAGRVSEFKEFIEEEKKKKKGIGDHPYGVKFGSGKTK